MGEGEGICLVSFNVYPETLWDILWMESDHVSWSEGGRCILIPEFSFWDIPCVDSEHVSEDGGICPASANSYYGWRANMYHKLKVEVDAVLLPLSLSCWVDECCFSLFSCLCSISRNGFEIFFSPYFTSSQLLISNQFNTGRSPEAIIAPPTIHFKHLDHLQGYGFKIFLRFDVGSHTNVDMLSKDILISVKVLDVFFLVEKSPRCWYPMMQIDIEKVVHKLMN